MSRLPSAYQKVEYLQGSGMTASPTGPYINTSYKAVSENYKIKSKFTVANIVHNTVLFGGGASTDIISAMMTSDSNLKFYVGSGSVSGALSPFLSGVDYEMECVANNGTLTVTLNGTSRSGVYSGSINKDYPLFIFANNSSGSAAQYSSLKVYWFQIYDNGILVRDFVPCYRKSDNVAGLYDTAQGAFYTNAGTGTFAIGPEISEPVVITGGLMPFAFAMRRLMASQKAVIYTITVTGTLVYGDSVCILKLNGVQITEAGEYTANAGDELSLGIETSRYGLPAMSPIKIDGTTVAQGNGAEYTHIVDSNCTVACTAFGTGYTSQATITLTRT